MYKLRMVVPNIKHKHWWWNGKEVYTFDTLGELICFMDTNIPFVDDDVDYIKSQDFKTRNGSLLCTSWYEVYKGEKQMTEYTSF